MSGFYNGPAPAGGYPPPPPVPPVKTQRTGKRWTAILAPAVLALVLLVGLVAFHGGSSGSRRPAAGGSGIPTLAGAPRTSAPSNPNNFTAPTSVPAGAVPAYRGNLTGFVIPQGLTLEMAQIQADGAQYQLLAADSTNVVRSIIEAWAAGEPNAARYASWCVAGCAGAFDPLINEYGSQHPRGTLVVTDWTGGFATGSTTSAEVGVCVDDSRLTVTTASGGTQSDPHVQGPAFWAFGLVYDPPLKRWIATEAYRQAGSSYCTED